MTFGGILTAMVTPFDDRGRVAEESTARLVRHLLEHGSDGLVATGTTGESPTLSDDEAALVWEIAVAEAGGAPVIAGTGTNDTRHTIELTERATAAGVDGVLVVAPYYNKPNARGIKAHYEAVAASTPLPVVIYNIPSRSVIDIPNALLRELAEIENIKAVKQARPEDLEAIEGLDLLAGNDDMLADVMDAGGTGGICVASHVVGSEMRRVIDEPDRRHELERELADLYKAMFVTASPAPVKCALNMLGLDVGGVRLPLVEVNDEEAAVVRKSLERHGLLSAV